MDGHELAEKIKEIFKNQQMTKEIFNKVLGWCNANTESMDLANEDHFYLYLISTKYLMKPNQILNWNDSDVNIVMNFMIKKAIKDYKLQNTSFKLLNEEEYKQRNGETSSATCVNQGYNSYVIEYSPYVKELLLSKNTGQILRGFQTLFHEIIHALQNTYIRKEGINAPETYLMAVETIARKQAPEIYYANYEYLLKENDAEKLGLETAMIYIEKYGPELYKLYNQKVIEQMKKDYDAKFYEGKINLFGKNKTAAAQIDKACSMYVINRPDILKEFPVLQWGFNLNGTKKTLEELLSQRQELLETGKPLDKVNGLFRTLANNRNFIKDTPYSTKEEVCYLINYIAKTGTDDEFIFELMNYRLNKTDLSPEKIEEFMLNQRNYAKKIREKLENQEEENKPTFKQS